MQQESATVQQATIHKPLGRNQDYQRAATNNDTFGMMLVLNAHPVDHTVDQVEQQIEYARGCQACTFL